MLGLIDYYTSGNGGKNNGQYKLGLENWLDDERNDTRGRGGARKIVRRHISLWFAVEFDDGNATETDPSF